MSLSDADRLEIEELVYRYNHATDAGDGDTRADLFTEDGIFVAPGRDLRGRDAIRAATRASGRRHGVNNLVLDGQVALTGAVDFQEQRDFVVSVWDEWLG